MTQKFRLTLLCCIAFICLSSGCQPGTTPPVLQPNVQPDPQVMVTFRVTLPVSLPPGEKLFLAELDEVTGLAFNQTQHIMEAEDSQHFIVIIPIRINSVLKYRYIRQGDYTSQEYTTDGRPVRYRLFHAASPALVQDIISRWADRQPDEAPNGRIIGRAIKAGGIEPIPNLLIEAGGQQTWTTADGTFMLEGLPAGTHNLVAYAADGAYLTFQQGALVAAGAATEAALQLLPANFVNVTFYVDVPENTPSNANLRIAGNLWQLGNSFTELRGGLSSTALRLPELKHLENGRYGLTFALAAGSDVRYKYTLGDGIWNAEHTTEGHFIVRQLIVPNKDIQISDQVARWDDNSKQPVTFQVNVPAVTPDNEGISIQFNPGYAWLEALPMWSTGSDLWEFTLFSPLRGLDSIQYRYCRETQCGSADDAATAGNLATGRLVDLTSEIRTHQDKVDAWAWLEGMPGTAVVPNLEITPRQPGFIAGIALQVNYHPSWLAHLNLALDDIRSMNSNTIILHPTWTVVRSSPPFQEGLQGHELSGFDLNAVTNVIRSQGLRTVLFPLSTYPKSANIWWQEASRDFPWWVSWFERYTTFIRHHAIIAAQTGSEALVLGDASVAAALPNGKLADGSPSNAPEDTTERWRSLIQAARQNYNGQIWWALQFPQDLQNPPAFLDAVDGLYVVWSASLSQDPGAAANDMAHEAAAQLDTVLLPLQQQLNKPVILAIAYPSAQGGNTGCLPGLEPGCLPLDLLSPPNPDIPNIALDLANQEKAYNAMFLAIKDRAWISGVVSLGYYPSAVLQDKSISIHGKPARGVLWFWFGRFLGK